MRLSKPHGAPERNPDLSTLYQSVREASARLGAPLSDADATVQSMADASPAKWHLAHTTWFFERMVLEPNLPGYRAFDPQFNFLFNSYYESIGARQPRPRRGMITRPALETIIAYRDHVDRAMVSLMQDDLGSAVAELIELGCNHEQQHQELLLTDILHLFAENPLRPAYKDPGPIAVDETDSAPPVYRKFDGGVVEVGHDGQGFGFDCEGPRHRVLVEPYELANRLVTNAEWMAFIADGGYRAPLLWLSAGWATVQSEGWSAPLYWEEREGGYWSMTLRGAQPVDPDAPVTHVSYYEADAFATWVGRRLPTEFEWEHAALGEPLRGNFVELGTLASCACTSWANGPTSDLRRCVGVDAERLCALPALQAGGRGSRRIQRQVHVRAVHLARRLVRDSGRVTCGRVTAISFPPMHDGSSRGLGWRETSDMLDLVESKLSQHEAFRADVLAGLSQRQKTLPSRWLYDQRGSELFEEITRLDEYYLTRTETAILRRHAEEMAALCGEGIVLLEYGAGAAIKSEILIDALHEPRMYAPIDIAADFLARRSSDFAIDFLSCRRGRSSRISRPTLTFQRTFPLVPAPRFFLARRSAISCPRTRSLCCAECAIMSDTAARRSSASTCARTFRH